MTPEQWLVVGSLLIVCGMYAAMLLYFYAGTQSVDKEK